MSYALLFSGGKDSNYSLYLAKNRNINVNVLVTAIPEEDSYLFHYININIVDLQAKSLEIPLYKFYTKTESETKDLEIALYEVKKEYNIKGLIAGIIKSNFQYKNIKKICEKLNLDLYLPLWNINEEEYLYDLLKNKFEIIISGFFAYPFYKDLLGKKIDNETIEILKMLNKKYKINLVGEGGEIETTVLYQPLFKKRIIIDEANLIIGENYGIFKIEKAHLE